MKGINLHIDNNVILSQRIPSNHLHTQIGNAHSLMYTKKNYENKFKLPNLTQPQAPD